MSATDRPPITAEDLLRLMHDWEMRDEDQPFHEWLAREGFESSALPAFALHVAEDFREGERLETLVVFGFVAGWEAHRDLRGERS